MEWPSISIIVVTFDRAAEIRRTLMALRTHLHYEGKLSWHLADDGSPGLYIYNLLKDFPELNFTYTITSRGGWGVNVNTALRQIDSDYVFICEDDYLAVAPLDLTQGIRLMQLRPEIGLVRYDGLCGHVGQSLRLCEALPFCELDYLVIEPRLTQHHFTYSHRPHLKHRRFHQYYGLYAEGLPLAHTEVEFAKRVMRMADGPQIAILSDGIPRAFEHIGESRQGTEEDIGCSLSA
jgi:glycosyltransferase involved in cell wall biosynthesis